MARPPRTSRIAWLAIPVTATLAAAAWLAVPSLTKAAGPRPSRATEPRTAEPARPHPGPAESRSARKPAGGPAMLNASVRARCAPAAAACADLAAHLTWLQADGHITYGPIRMEPGAPSDPTPKGIFHVAWKAGRHYVSTSYGVPIPYAVFFAAGGVAFHEGSLTTSSHGCIHLTMAAARYYNEHLPVGATVDVF